MRTSAVPPKNCNADLSTASFPAFNRMYIRFISLEMFITDKGGLDTSHISLHQSLKQSPFFKSSAKEEIGDFDCNGLKMVAARNLQMLITRDSFCTLKDFYHPLSRCTIGGGTSSSSRSWSWPSILSSPTCWEGYLPVWYIADTERSCCLVGWLSQCPQPVGLIIHSD